MLQDSLYFSSNLKKLFKSFIRVNTITEIEYSTLENTLKSERIMLSNNRIMKTSAKIMLLLTCLMNFMTLNQNINMHSSNGNVPRVFVAGHQNWGRGELKNKIDDVLDILDDKKCHVLGISERTMDESSYNILTNHGYEIEVKEDSPRISVIIDKDISYTRRKDL